MDNKGRTTCKSEQCFNLFRRKVSDILGNCADNSSARMEGRKPRFSTARNSRYRYTNSLFIMYVWTPLDAGDITSMWGSYREQSSNILEISREIYTLLHIWMTPAIAIYNGKIDYSIDRTLHNNWVRYYITSRQWVLLKKE